MPARESTTAFSTSGSPIKAAKTFAAHLAIRWQLSQAGAPLAAALASLVENLLMRSTTPPNRVPALIPARVRETRDRVIVAEVWSLANCSPATQGWDWPQAMPQPPARAPFSYCYYAMTRLRVH
ncbi:hypothetical protein [Nocardia farcinica]|uniref:hypothetical protein n=1 Tax=Nocardia farcinica TaxID=37329 RepID=UPI0015F03AFA|nr:hypothetical protein [Nocardia farcinica]MBA4857542.1 hypothetical protein [Nocardia farcinica]MBC9816159.1 hypothetical protein [Nocardia farcinica]